MITKSTRKPATAGRTQPVTAGTSITSGARNRQAPRSAITAATNLTPAQRAFARQLEINARRSSAIMAATNTTNIMARPDFLELLPMFTQKLLVLDVFGSVAMKSRQQLVPYFKFIAENTKGETRKGDILNSPFVNRQGIDKNFTGRVIKNEYAVEGAFTGSSSTFSLAYCPILPGSVTFTATVSGVASKFVDDGSGDIKNASGTSVGYINYSNGTCQITSVTLAADDDSIVATYQYDNENVGPDESGNYGAQMGKGYLQLDEFDLIAEAHELACYWSIYAAFASSTEYGGNVADIAKEAAIGELTAEINANAFAELKKAAMLNPQFNWDASPVLSGSVVPSDYLNMFKLKLSQAAASIYQATRLTQPNRLVVGTNTAAYIGMINGFQADGTADNVGPYKAGKLDQFDIYVDPNYDPNEWVMCCKSNDIRRNSALFGEYMPIMSTDPITLANASVQQGHASMYAMKVVNPDTCVRGKIVGTF